jgi:hypothetical protein
VIGHAGTFLRQETREGELALLKYYDPNENHFFEKGDHKIDYKKSFDRYSVITLHTLKGRPVADKVEEDRITNKMTRIILGEISEEYLKNVFVKILYLLFPI